jgi:hypothetical protein
VEILDHQLKLKDQNVPSDAIYLIKRSGIIGDGVAPPTFCLYVQLPQMEDFLLLKQDIFFQRCWVTLKASRLYFYLDINIRDTPCYVIPLYEVTGIEPSPETDEFLQAILSSGNKYPLQKLIKDVNNGCGFELFFANGGTIQLMAKSVEEKNKWVITLSKWLKFFPDDGKTIEYQPCEDIFFQNFHEFFINET